MPKNDGELTVQITLTAESLMLIRVALNAYDLPYSATRRLQKAHEELKAYIADRSKVFEQ